MYKLTIENEGNENESLTVRCKAIIGGFIPVEDGEQARGFAAIEANAIDTAHCASITMGAVQELLEKYPAANVILQAFEEYKQSQEIKNEEN